MASRGYGDLMLPRRLTSNLDMGKDSIRRPVVSNEQQVSQYFVLHPT
jgi:hypothetical protein